ncbi:MAG: GNAT family N-acetyltransferase [Prevotella sp.]|nr:GNAT family N-acetyltransferase [Prevotellaceae bacterium]MDY3365809.1 GNAT family N-acetyltransferase [Prevotella sp.]MDY3853005.1 GNAT family N-acetyltransferase [Prevotella sp.]
MEIKKTEKGTEGLIVGYDGDEQMGYISYVWESEEVMNIQHTIVDPKHEGKGVASALLNYAVDFARQNNKKIQTSCSFVQAKFNRSGAYDDVKAK